MEKKFDVTLKSLLEDSPEDWPILAGVEVDEVRVIDADVSTISGAADKVLHLPGPPPWIMHFEFQAGPDASLPRRVNVYNAALEDRHDLPVASVVVLLRPEANLRAISGVYQRQAPHASEPYRVFRYQVIRVWELPVQSLLGGGLGRLALAPISAVGESQLPDVLREMRHRVSRLPDRGSAWSLVDGRVRADGFALRTGSHRPVIARGSGYGRINDVSGHRAKGTRRGNEQRTRQGTGRG